MTPENSPERKLVTKPELAARYCVVPRTIDNWIAERRIPSENREKDGQVRS